VPNVQDYDIQLQTVRSGFDGKTCWVSPRAGVAPDGRSAVIALQQVLLGSVDVFFGACAMYSGDAGRTWTAPQPIPTLARRTAGGGPIATTSSGTGCRCLSPRWTPTGCA